MEPDPLALPAKTFARGRLNTSLIVAILWSSAFKSIYRAFIILLFGNIALGIAGSIWHDMMPSKTPGISISAGNWDWTSGLNRHSFGIVWFLSFVVLSAFRLSMFLPDARHRNFVKRLRKIELKISHNWFNLIVSNVIGAMVSAFVINLMSQISWSAILWKELIRPVIAPAFSFFAALIGAHAAGTIQGWVQWYGDNSLKFTFWSIYLGLIADDLGLPNVKTLGLWLFMRARRRLGLVEPEPGPVIKDAS